MKIRFSFLILFSLALTTQAQDRLSPELLWDMARVGGTEVSPDQKSVLYGVSKYDIQANKGNRDLYVVPVAGGDPVKITSFSGSEFNEMWRPDGKKIGFLSGESGSVQLWEVNPDGTGATLVTSVEGGINSFRYAPDMKHILVTRDVKLDQTLQEKYPDLPKANVRVTDELMYRHWSSWHDYAFSHVFYADYQDGKVTGEMKDIMPNERFDSPLNPFGGIEQINWGAGGNSILYTCKKMTGAKYASSTNSDLYSYDLASGKTSNITAGMMGYDMEPQLSPDGKILAWLSMEKDGFESDKNDIIIMDLANGNRINLTADIDQTVSGFTWGADTKTIYYKSVVNATYQLFSLDTKSKASKAITSGRHNYTSIAFAGKSLVATRQSMDRPNELYRVNIKNGEATALTDANKDIYTKLKVGKVEKRMIKTSDNKDMLTWVIYPPDFDPNKKYPTLLYCQGGPQSAVSQFFSFRWNFQLMAAQGYIIVAPNRRGLPGFGQEWNDAISKDWGGQAMRDYLSAIDAVAEEPFVNKDKLGAVGASYGGYSVYYLAGIHEGRFKTFISHCGLFNLESWYGSTEEMFFANWDIGGPYWKKENEKLYQSFSPHRFVQNWDTPILVIHGEKDFRVPIGEGLQAFNTAQLKNIPSRFLYFPTEGHWVLSPQNGLVWHREFFEWLDLWLKK